ncbi:MAG: trypsin-like peptidase domain-containing protein, partial [Anaerolineales bacterium]
VTTAHSLADLGRPGHSLERIAFTLAGQSNPVIEFDTLHGQPGLPRTGFDLSIDWVLLKANQPVDSNLVLTPDPRGAPQPGERVSLFSGLGDGNGGRRELEGTVQSVDPTGIWVLMDEAFDAGRMSGSPLLSQHTGQVVGMAIAVMPRRNRLMIGFHPIGHLVVLAEEAAEFPTIAGYRR